jgi:flagellar biosynthesis protein FlhA
MRSPGLFITLLNLVMGLVIGVAIHGMPLGRAFETYAILTVGDGLVSQIPAVIISIATALLLSRGGATGSTDTAVFSQLGRFPAALGTVALLLGFFALVPGLPFLPFLMGAVGLGAAALLVRRKASRMEEETAAPAEIQPRPRSMGDVLDLDEIHVEFSPDLVPMILDPSTGLEARIANMRQHVATVFGLILPEIRLTDNAALPDGQYVIRIQGVEQARDRLRPERYLALIPADPPPNARGEEVREPVYGAPAMWVAPDQGDDLALNGLTVVTPAEVLATHLLEVVKRNFPRLLTLRSLRGLLDEMGRVSDPARAEANRRLLDELVPDRVPPDMLLSVLRLLLEERVSIRNMPLILEAIAEARTPGAGAEQITENVRQRLGFQILAELRREDGTVPLIQLAPGWEETFHAHQLESGNGRTDVALPPDVFNRLASAVADRIAEVGASGVQAGVVTSVKRRRFLRTVIASRGLTNPVLSYDEIGLDARPALVGLVPA